jgi:hypothetical protein
VQIDEANQELSPFLKNVFVDNNKQGQANAHHEKDSGSDQFYSMHG